MKEIKFNFYLLLLPSPIGNTNSALYSYTKGTKGILKNPTIPDPSIAK